jgi:hypothetical protein
MAVKTGLVGGIYNWDSAAGTTFTGEAATLSADGKSLQIDDLTKGLFKPDKTLFVVKKGGTSIGVNFELAPGKILFNEVQTAGTWTIDGTHVDVAQIGGCFEWSVDIKMVVQDYVAFGDTWVNKAPMVKGWSGSVKKYWASKTLSITDTERVLCLFKFYTDLTNHQCWVGYGYVNSSKITASADKLTEEDLGIDGCSGLFYYGTAIGEL